MNEREQDRYAVIQLAEERLRLELIERAAVDGLTPIEIQSALNIERNRRADREAEAARREREQ